MNKGSGMKMVQYGATKKIRSDAMEYEAYVRSHIALVLYMLQVEVLKIVMSVGTSDIRQFYEY